VRETLLKKSTVISKLNPIPYQHFSRVEFRFSEADFSQTVSGLRSNLIVGLTLRLISKHFYMIDRFQTRKQYITY